MRLGRLSARPGSLLVTIGIAALLFLTALVVMSAIAGPSSVTGRLQVRLSFWFALAFVAEAVAFAGYVFAYRSIAAIERGPRLELPRRRRAPAPPSPLRTRLPRTP